MKILPMSKNTSVIKCLLVGLLLTPAVVFGETTVPDSAAAALREVQQYNFAIHILAMLLVGFGFLMVFVQRYGYSATTGTYLVVAVGLPVYSFCAPWGC